MLMMDLIAGRRTLRIRQVVAKVGLSEATIWRLSAAGKFPKPIKISSGCTVWLEREIDEMVDAKAAEREAVA
jgi:prophage regulatory protein